MTKDDTRNAKDIFMHYGGSHFFMSREGDYERYISFGVSKEQEQLWISELQINLLANLYADPTDSGSVFDYCRTINQSKNSDALRLITQKIKDTSGTTDSFTKLLIAEALLEVIKKIDIDNISYDIKQAFDTSIELLNNVLENPITVAIKYKDCGYLDDKIVEEKIIERAHQNLNRWKHKDIKRK